MNPIKQIGRYELPILSVLLIKKREGFWARIWPGYDAILNTGQKLRLTEEEKQRLDQAREEHEMTMQVYGMCKGLGLRGA